MTIRFRKPLPAQAAARRSRARFIVEALGRRSGKTEDGVDWTLEKCLDQRVPPSDAWWVAPSYPMAMIGWRPMLDRARQIRQAIPGVRILESDYRIEFPWGAAAQCKSAHDVDSLRGPKLRALVLDECAYIKKEAWTEVLRPALSDLRAPVRFKSSPKGKANWFHELFLKGRDPLQPRWESFQFPTSANPFIDAEEIEEARRDLSDRIFRQEYLAEFLDNSGGVFRYVMDAAQADALKAPLVGHKYVFGIDWAHSARAGSDFASTVCLDVGTETEAFVERSRGDNYTTQELRLLALNERWKPVAIVAESNAMGQPMIDRLRRLGLPVVGYQNDNDSKAEWVEMLILAFERRTLTIIRDAIHIGELEAYVGVDLPSGKIRFTHPKEADAHDDTVDALGLAYWGMRKASRRLSGAQRERMIGAVS